MEDPKTLEELKQWTVQEIAKVRPEMNTLELEMLAEIIVAPYEDPLEIPEFTDQFKIWIKSWPLNKGGIA